MFNPFGFTRNFVQAMVDSANMRNGPIPCAEHNIANEYRYTRAYMVAQEVSQKLGVQFDLHVVGDRSIMMPAMAIIPKDTGITPKILLSETAYEHFSQKDLGFVLGHEAAHTTIAYEQKGADSKIEEYTADAVGKRVVGTENSIRAMEAGERCFLVMIEREYGKDMASFVKLFSKKLGSENYPSYNLRVKALEDGVFDEHARVRIAELRGEALPVARMVTEPNNKQPVFELDPNSNRNLDFERSMPKLVDSEGNLLRLPEGIKLEVREDGRISFDVNNPSFDTRKMNNFNIATEFFDSTKTGKFLGNSTRAGTSMGMSTYAVISKLANGQFAADLKAGGAQASWARASLGADITALGIDTTAFTLQSNKVINAITAISAIDDAAQAAKFAGSLGKFARGAGPAGMILSVAAGGFEFKAAEEAGDGHRAARAIGSTGGGLIGGIAVGAGAGFLYGAAGGSPTGPGALVTGGIGAVAGGFIGAWTGGELTDKALGEKLQKKYDAKFQQEIESKISAVNELFSDEMVTQYTESAKQVQEFSEAGSKFSGSLIRHGSMETEGISELFENFHDYIHQLEKLEDLPSTNYDAWQKMYDLREQIGDMYAREAMRAVPKDDVSAEQTRVQNVEILGQAWNKIESMRGIDSVNSGLRANRYEMIESAQELIVTLQKESWERQQNKTSLAEEESSIYFPINPNMLPIENCSAIRR